MNLRELLAKASPQRSGDELAGLAAQTAQERVRAQMKLADVPLSAFRREPIIPYETDEVTRLICDTHDTQVFDARGPVAKINGSPVEGRYDARGAGPRPAIAVQCVRSCEKIPHRLNACVTVSANC